MKKFLIAVAAMFAAASPALAQNAPAASPAPAETRGNIDCNKIDITKYTAEELGRVQSLCNTTVAAAEQVTPEDVREWASLAASPFQQVASETQDPRFTSPCYQQASRQSTCGDSHDQ